MAQHRLERTKCLPKRRDPWVPIGAACFVPDERMN